ncbi:disks large-associated protein 5 isoform X2 [Nerophis lumbriciformis]|uniref:disks large-associated protein 5 isoform X2 n=1 Tax=Nerophis lumbriciformis TaxID=546530 RepID=UPI002ADF7304|nr:disks large-associated protein 5-like isoform X2 [Nerophis lumbriciformis]
MDSKFSHFRQRDNSVSMLRVKMSRRSAQSQKENREKVVNARRQLDKLQELEISSLDASMAVTNTSTIKEITNLHANSAKGTGKAVEERLKQLARWKERKALQKEKEKQEKERKGVFKTGLYHPKDTQCLFALPPIPAAFTKAKETKTNTAPSQSTRVTRSMRQQQTQKPLKTPNPNTTAKKERPTRGAPVKAAPTLAKKNICPVVPVVRAQSIRSVNRSVPAAPVVTNEPHDKSEVQRITRSKATVEAMVPPSGKGGNCKADIKLIVHPAATPLASLSALKAEELDHQEPEKPQPPKSTTCPEENMKVDEEAAEELSSLASFAPKGFVFQAPVGVSAFKFEPLTPRSADAFLTPSFNFPPAPVFTDKPQAKPSGSSPPKSPRRSPPPAPSSPLESKHDVPYFRSEINNETDKLMSLSAQWETKVEDESIPEEMRDRMRTAIGQARLLMKERFNQFSGLVDDCELVRGDKLTTCSDLQGFWDMVYFQVEDVSRKFDALKEAEVRGWVDEHKPQARQRKAVKKPVVAPAKPPGTKAGAKSRLAAIKAAMRAKKQAAEAEEASKVAGDTQDEATPPEGPQSQVAPQATDTVVFDGGFFSVASPARASGYVRRSRRLSAAMPPHASPCSSYLSPRRVTRRSLALAQTHGTPVQGNQTPLCLSAKQTSLCTPRLQLHTPQPTADTSLSFLPPTEMPSCSPLLEETSACPAEMVSVQESTMGVLPTISVVQENDEAAKSVTTALSFMPSPSSTPCQCSPTTTTSPAVQSSKGTPKSMCTTPASSFMEEIPGLDFERYLQPSQRCSLSPMEPVTMETLSSMTVDVEMESPRSQSEHLTQQEALPPPFSPLTPQTTQEQTAQASLLLFTPNLKDRIRPSVCPSDLMYFTPPL